MGIWEVVAYAAAGVVAGGVAAVVVLWSIDEVSAYTRGDR